VLGKIVIEVSEKILRQDYSISRLFDLMTSSLNTGFMPNAFCFPSWAYTCLLKPCTVPLPVREVLLSGGTSLCDNVDANPKSGQSGLFLKNVFLDVKMG